MLFYAACAEKGVFRVEIIHATFDSQLLLGGLDRLIVQASAIKA